MIFDEYNLYLILPFIFLTGISIGSFVTLASYRIPLSQEIVFKPSYCPNCNTRLKIADLFPLFSWVIQKGCCRHCHKNISSRYPLIELALGLVFVGIALFCGINISALLIALLATELAILIVTDFEHYIIPDRVQVAIFFTAIAYRLYSAEDYEEVVTAMAEGIAMGMAIGLILHYGYIYLRRKDALGFGDVKFLAVAGCWLPVADFVPFLFFSGLIGIITGIIWRILGKGPVFPFGPALAISLFINILVPDILGLFQRFAL